jgi:hypothetical protein
LINKNRNNNFLDKNNNNIFNNIFTIINNDIKNDYFEQELYQKRMKNNKRNKTISNYARNNKHYINIGNSKKNKNDYNYMNIYNYYKLENKIKSPINNINNENNIDINNINTANSIDINKKDFYNKLINFDIKDYDENIKNNYNMDKQYNTQTEFHRTNFFKDNINCFSDFY